VKLIWMTVSALLAVAAAGCSDDKSAPVASTPAVSPDASALTTTAVSTAHDEAASGVRIPLGEARKVPIPADAVMDIKVPAEWGTATSSLRCVVTDSSGRNEDLRSTNVKRNETIGGKEWTTLWTFSSPAGAEVTVGCKDPESKISAEDGPSIRVVPRGIAPH
jgi:hypothetical protein